MNLFCCHKFFPIFINMLFCSFWQYKKYIFLFFNPNVISYGRFVIILFVISKKSKSFFSKHFYSFYKAFVSKFFIFSLYNFKYFYNFAYTKHIPFSYSCKCFLINCYNDKFLYFFSFWEIIQLSTAYDLFFNIFSKRSKWINLNLSLL